MDYRDYTYTAETQAQFYRAETELLRFSERFARSPSARYMRSALLAIDAVFAMRMSYDVTLPVVNLVTAYDLTNWKYDGDTRQSVRAKRPEFRFPEEHLEIATKALHYMQAMNWIAENSQPDVPVTLDTVLKLHEILLSGSSKDGLYHGFRTKPLPGEDSVRVASIPLEVNDLCDFMNRELFSPLGQASVIHHAFEQIAPFDTLVDHTGLVLAFMSMFRRGLFSKGYFVPICWGTSTGKEYRRQLRSHSRDYSSTEEHERYRERWAVYNAQNTRLSVAIASSFLETANRLRREWRSRDLQISRGSAMDRLLDLFLAVPNLSTVRASMVIGKSYGATNEAMWKIAKSGIVREVAVDDRERVFTCDQSAAMMNGFVRKLEEKSERAEERDGTGVSLG